MKCENGDEDLNFLKNTEREVCTCTIQHEDCGYSESGLG